MNNLIIIVTIVIITIATNILELLVYSGKIILT
jgi:hypothetical protein